MKIAFFPELLPDELLFSGIANLRHFHEEAHTSFLKAAVGIRGSTQSYLGLPTNLPAFVESLPICSSLTVERISRDHTLTPLLRPFLRIEMQDNLGQAINGTTEGARIDCVHQHLVHEDLHFRYCPTCWKEDQQNHGRPYWHRCHQIKHVTACHRHHCQLITAPESWLTPSLRSSFISAEVITPVTESSSASPEAIAYATEMRDALTLDANCNAHSLRHAALELLRCRGMVHNDGGIDWGQLREAIDQAFSKDTQIRLESDSSYLAKEWNALSSPSTRAWLKPAQFFVFTRALGYELKDLLTLAATQRWETGPWQCMNAAAPCFGQPTIKRYGLEATGHARFMCPFCLGSYLRTLPLTRELDGSFKYEVTSDSKGWRAALPALWKDQTLSLDDIAERLGKTYSEIRSNAAALRLGNRRRCRRSGCLSGRAPIQTSDLVTRRAKWLKLVEENPGVSKTALLKSHASLGEWFYRNDRQWFAENTPQYTKKKRTSTVNYQERDIRYAAAVPNIAAEILAQDPPVAVSVNGIAHRLKLTLSKENLRELYPETAKAIDEAVATQPEFIDRAIDGITKVWLERDRVPTWYEFISTRALFARRCTRDGEFRQKVLQHYQEQWPENPNYIPGTLKPVVRRRIIGHNRSPQERLANCIYPFGELVEGASFFAPLNDRDPSALQASVIRTMHYYKSKGFLPKAFRLSAKDEQQDGVQGIRFTWSPPPKRPVVTMPLEASVPVQTDAVRLNLPLEQMMIGESFFVPNQKRTGTSTAAMVRAAIRDQKLQGVISEDFKTQIMPESKQGVDGVRVWRVAPTPESLKPQIEPAIPLPNQPAQEANGIPLQNSLHRDPVPSIV